MPLPEIKHPLFKLTIPSTKKTVTYRPFTVKEEKLLLTVRLSEDIEEIIQTLKQIIQNCIIDDINVDKLAMFDIEYIFINLRRMSVSNEVELYLEEDGVKIPFTVDLSNVQVKFNPKHKNVVEIDEKLGFKMKYPSMLHILKLEDLINSEDYNSSKVDDYIFEIFIDCVDSVYDDNSSYSDFSKEELNKFVLSLPNKSMEKVKEFYETMPVLEHVEKIRTKDGTIKEVKLRGLKDFFTF